MKRQQRRWQQGSPGISMSEILVALALFIMLLILLLLSLKTQRLRANDAERKHDLEKIKVAFEDYYNDNGCYPPSNVLEICGSDSFRPYIHRIECDPVTNEPYRYAPLPDDPCKGYRVYATLEDPNDPIIGQLGCSNEWDCGVGEGYNYGISVGVPVYAGQPAASPVPSSSPSPSLAPSPSPSPQPSNRYVYACGSGGICNEFEVGSPYLENCPITFEDRFCNNLCEDNPQYWCQ